jgi:hypothetical protein
MPKHGKKIKPASAQAMPTANIVVVLPYEFSAAYGTGKRLYTEAIRVGRYVHPIHGWTLDVTPDRIDHWVKQASLMMSRGDPIPLVDNAEHKLSNDNQIGYLFSAHREGDGLILGYEFPTDEAVEKARQVKYCSLTIWPEYVDGQSNKYADVIHDVALTPKPVAIPQEGFYAIAASQSSQQAGKAFVYQLAAVSDKGVEDMFPPEQKAKALAATGAGDETGDVELIDAMLAMIDQLKAKLEELSKAEKAEPGSAEPMTASQLEALEDKAEIVANELETMQAAGQITPANAKALSAVLLGTHGQRNAYMLSRIADPLATGGVGTLRARQILSVVKACTAVKLGQQTKGQALSQSADGTETVAFDAAKEAERIRGMKQDQAVL